MSAIFQYDDTLTLSAEIKKTLANQVKADIDAFCVKEFTGDHRTHLGASVIGQECARKIWYDFRWVKYEIFEPRMLRLFNRGKMEEELFIKWLRGIGCQVWEVEPEILHYHPESDDYFLAKEFNNGDGLVEDVTGIVEHELIAKSRNIERKQFRIWGVNGHYGGSSDSIGILPYMPDLGLLLEFKTHNTKSFVNLTNKGLMLSKPQHYAQMCSYGAFYQFKYGMYVAVNKNDDDLYIEIVELDWKRAHDLVNKAQDIIEAKIPPKRIAENPAYYACNYCNKKGICWENEPVEINCRSCKHSTPVENKQWKCELYNNIIPEDFIKKGCENHVSINS